MRQCVIWDANDAYEAIINQIKFEELKGNLTCAAILSTSMAGFTKKRDGYAVIGKEDLKNVEFDYLIIAARIPIRKFWQRLLQWAFLIKNNRRSGIADSKL